jgi:DnaJ-class molecular chaperone
MAEEKKENPNPKGEEAFRQIIREELKQALAENTAQTSKNISDTSEQPPDKHEHWKAEEFINASDTCVDCKAEKEKLKESFGKPYLEQHWREKLPDVCSNCGEGVLLDEKNCPKCKGRKAHKRA